MNFNMYSLAILIFCGIFVQFGDARATLTQEDAERALHALNPNAQDTVVYVGIHSGKAFFRDAAHKTVDFAGYVQFCQTNKMRTASIMSKEENEVIRNYFTDASYYSLFWLGGWDINQEGNYYWLDTNKPFVFKNWYFDVPTDSRFANCAYMTRSGYWMNKNCDESSGLVTSLCELQLLD